MQAAEALEIEAALSELYCRPQGFEEKHYVGRLLVRGYSATAIDLKFYDRFAKRLERPWLDRLVRKVRRSGKLRRIQEAEEDHVLSTGLARKVERVRRLAEYVESIERAALTTPGKIGIEYRRGIDQIKQEVEGLGIDVTIHPADAWAQLLTDIYKLGEDRANLGEALLGAGAVDAPTPGSEAE